MKHLRPKHPQEFCVTRKCDDIWRKPVSSPAPLKLRRGARGRQQPFIVSQDDPRDALDASTWRQSCCLCPLQARVTCVECSDTFCEACAKKIHSLIRGLRTHELVWIAPSKVEMEMDDSYNEPTSIRQEWISHTPKIRSQHEIGVISARCYVSPSMRRFENIPDFVESFTLHRRGVNNVPS